MRTNYPETYKYLQAQRARHPREDAIEDYTEWTVLGEPTGEKKGPVNLPPGHKAPETDKQAEKKVCCLSMTPVYSDLPQATRLQATRPHVRDRAGTQATQDSHFGLLSRCSFAGGERRGVRAPPM